jgi:hypothetical protein
VTIHIGFRLIQLKLPKIGCLVQNSTPSGVNALVRGVKMRRFYNIAIQNIVRRPGVGVDSIDIAARHLVMKIFRDIIIIIFRDGLVFPATCIEKHVAEDMNVKVAEITYIHTVLKMHFIQYSTAPTENRDHTVQLAANRKANLTYYDTSGVVHRREHRFLGLQALHLGLHIGPPCPHPVAGYVVVPAVIFIHSYHIFNNCLYQYYHVQDHVFKYRL